MDGLVVVLAMFPYVEIVRVKEVMRFFSKSEVGAHHGSHLHLLERTRSIRLPFTLCINRHPEYGIRPSKHS